MESSIQRSGSLLCVGIDPQEELESNRAYESLLDFGRRIVEQTASSAACFKPNIAFYEAYGEEGARALKHTIEHVPEGIPVILDAKRGDIGNTARAYSKSLFDYYAADATTLSPYLGREALIPFLERKEKGLFVLCRTSNPGAEIFQEIMINASAPVPYYLMLAEEVSRWGGNIGLVVAGNLPKALFNVRKLLPEIWILAPGIGAQGGVIEEAIRAGIRNDGRGLLLSVSRGISRADSPTDAARRMRDEINRVSEALKHG